MEWTVNDVISRMPRRKTKGALPAPRWEFSGRETELHTNLALAVESMKDHMTDEGWQIMLGLQHSGYKLKGYGIGGHMTDVKDLLMICNLETVVVQDKREWDVQRGDFREPRARFTNIQELARRPDIFKLTIVKDAHQNPEYHAESAREMGCHAWIIYYHPRIVKHLAWYIRPEHCIRTYHTINPQHLPRPKYKLPRNGCILSGAISNAYPLRQRIARYKELFPYLYVKPHPGYHRNKCETPAFLEELMHYRVAICTASIYGYSLRKIIEATAAGCIVVTDLPHDDVLPGIDENLVRVHPDITVPDLAAVLSQANLKYNSQRQEHYARLAIEYYNYQAQGQKLAENITILRNNWSNS